MVQGREEFLETLEDCERTSALLLLAMESGTHNPASLMALRDHQVECLSTALPAELSAEDLGRLKVLLKVGDQVRLRALAEKVSATQNLASLCGGLRVARQLAATRNPRESAVDFTG